MWFIDDDTLVATFVVREVNGSAELSTRVGSDANLPLRLRGFFLDANTGAIETRSDWGAQSAKSIIVSAHNGTFVTQSGNELTLYARSLEPYGKLTLPSLKGATEAAREWQGYPSPTGEHLLFLPLGLDTKTPRLWLWVDADSLKLLHSWKDIQDGWVAVADDKIAMIACTWMHECEPRVEVRSPADGWKTIASGNDYYRPQFVNDDLLYVFGSSRTLFRTEDGEVLARYDLPGAGALPSRDGKRFVVPVTRVRGHIAALDIAGHSLLTRFDVYDAAFDGRSYALSVKGPTLKDFMDFAVSPDGTKIAILNDETVEVFDLPPVRTK